MAAAGGESVEVKQTWLEYPFHKAEPFNFGKTRADMLFSFQLHDNYIVTIGELGSIEVWSKDGAKLLHEFKDHKGHIHCSALRGDFLLTCGSDCTFRVWNLKLGKCVHTVRESWWSMKCMALFEDKVAIGSHDKTVRLWLYESKECIMIFKGHPDAVEHIQYDGRRIVSACSFVIKIWDPEHPECLWSLPSHTKKITFLHFDGARIVTCCKNQAIRVWNMESLERTFEGKFRVAKVEGNIVIYCEEETGKTYARDIETGKELWSRPFKYGQFDTIDSQFVVGDAYSNVSLFDIRTGKHLRTVLNSLEGPTQRVWASGSKFAYMSKNNIWVYDLHKVE